MLLQLYPIKEITLKRGNLIWTMICVQVPNIRIAHLRVQSVILMGGVKLQGVISISCTRFV